MTTRSLLVLALLAVPSLARADGTSRLAAAEELFREGRALAEAGKFAEACPKFAESQRRDPAAGTLMNLADCYEKNGQTASAWVTWKEAAKAAQPRGRADWVNMATQRAAALEPRLSRLAIEVTADAPGLEVRRDGDLVDRAEWGAAIPLDPGPHAVEARAPGKAPWSTRAELGSGKVVVRVPALEAAAAPIAPAEPPPSPDRGAGQRTAGLVVGAIGVAGLAFGAVSGLVAIGKHDSAVSACASYPTHCPSDHSADDLNAQSQTWATISTIAFAAGAVGLAAGAVIYLTAPRAASPAAGALRLRVAPGAAFLERSF